MHTAFDDVIEAIGKAIDGLGVAVMVIGVVATMVLYAVRRATRPTDTEGQYRTARQRIGRAILLGLELLVAGDIIRTVAVSPTFGSVGVLAAIVAIRTFLSFTLEMEISGRWPWQEAPEDGPGGARSPAEPRPARIEWLTRSGTRPSW
ncbi:MAG: DUF1622 domain-containing protein [Acidimicrobiales bacterium]